MHGDAPGHDGSALCVFLTHAGHGVAHAGSPRQPLGVIAQGQLLDGQVRQQRRGQRQAAQTVNLGAHNIGLVAALLIQREVTVLHAAQQLWHTGCGGALLGAGERIGLNPGVGAAGKGGHGNVDDVREVVAALGADGGDVHASLLADNAVANEDDALCGAGDEGASVGGCFTGDGEDLANAVTTCFCGGGSGVSGVLSHDVVS